MMNKMVAGTKCVLKNFSLFRSGANVQDGCKIGKNVEIGVNQLVYEDIFDNTFFMPGFKGPAVIVNLGTSP
jgi:carbonic anhydrase/acetyltransferase-like protein (isoleucine patch superfamily)